MDRDLVDLRIEYAGFQEPCPSEAWGHFLGYEWWLYARWDCWDFTLSMNSEVDIFTLDLRGSAGEEIPSGVFFRQGQWCPSGEWKAGYMAVEEKMQVVRECLLVFETEHLLKHKE